MKSSLHKAGKTEGEAGGSDGTVETLETLLIIKREITPYKSEPEETKIKVLRRKLKAH